MFNAALIGESPYFSVPVLNSKIAYVQVKDARFDNGLLKIELVREIPEAMKPRRIAINGVPANNAQKQLEAKAA